MEGPARTGKSFALVTHAMAVCEWFPGAKLLFIRQTRKSMNNSVLTLWEDVLGRDHPALLPRKQKRTRDDYIFPYAETVVDGVEYKGVSEVHLIGFDNPERLMSCEYDGIYVFEATETSLHAWSLAYSRLSNAHVPWNYQIADCNPGASTHWLNLRADERKRVGDEETDEPKMERICTKLEDNPKMYDEATGEWTELGKAYNIKLDNLPPVERARLRDGKWVSQSGQVYPSWDTSKHMVRGKLSRVQDVWWLQPVEMDGIKGDFQARSIAYFVVGVDWGYFPDPGSAALYAVDDHQRAFVCQEWHTTKKPMDWWAKKLISWTNKYGVRAIICDVPQEKVDTLNAMMGGKLSDRGKRIAQLAKKGPGSVLAGIDIVRWALEDDEDGEPRLRYLTTAPMTEDPYLVDEMLPTGGAKEYPGYVFVPREDGKVNKAQPIDRDNHGLDRDRYVSNYLWENRHSAKPIPKKIENPGTMGAILNKKKEIHDAFKEAMRR